MQLEVEPVESLYPFVLTEEQEHLRREIREFAAREIAPNVSAWDEASEFPMAVVEEAGRDGAAGRDDSRRSTVARGWAMWTTCWPSKSSRPWTGRWASPWRRTTRWGPIIFFWQATRRRKRKFIPRLAGGECLAAWALTEPGSGSDASNARTTAVKKGDRYVLNGNKTFITNGRYAEVAVVIAVTDKSKGTHGLSAFVVEKGTPGFRAGKKENKLGLRASDTSELIFEDCEIPAENLLGAEGEGFIDAMRVLDGGRISIAALALGIARGALDAALSYVKERRQFGKAIAEFQGIQWKLADMSTELDAARLLTQRAAVLKDAGRKVTRESSMAKLFSSEVAVRICNEAVQLFGGYGFIKDYPVEKFYRDVKLCTIGEGTSEIQRMVIAREILKVHPSRGDDCNDGCAVKGSMRNAMKDAVKIVECPRDAWQGLPVQIAPEVKAGYLRRLVDAGFTHIDAVSFVSPAAVPQMADSERVLELLGPQRNVEIIGIVVNEKGAERAIHTGAVQTLGFPYSISAEFLRRNQHQTPEESLAELRAVVGAWLAMRG